MTRWGLLLSAAALLTFSLPASADVVLADWCVNNNGSVGPGNQQPSNSCNGGSLAADPNVNTTAFDTTLSPSQNSLGKITVAFGTGNQNILVYMDYDLGYNSFGSFDDFGTVVGALPAGFSYELDDPNTSGIFSDFAAGALTNQNNVDQATCAGNAPSNCDVSWALGWSTFVNPALFTGGSITFTVGSTAPGGFYLQQTNPDTGDNIFLSAAVTLNPVGGGGGSVPEPTTWVLLGSVMAFLFVARRKGWALGQKA